MERKAKDIEPLYLRGYCRVCNRHYFFKNKLDTGHLQLRQHHGGICQNCNYACARVNDHPRSGWLGFYRHRREKTGARSAPIVEGETGCEAPGLENPIKVKTGR